MTSQVLALLRNCGLIQHNGAHVALSSHPAVIALRQMGAAHGLDMDGFVAALLSIAPAALRVAGVLPPHEQPTESDALQQLLARFILPQAPRLQWGPAYAPWVWVTEQLCDPPTLSLLAQFHEPLLLLFRFYASGVEEERGERSRGGGRTRAGTTQYMTCVPPLACAVPLLHATPAESDLVLRALRPTDWQRLCADLQIMSLSVTELALGRVFLMCAGPRAGVRLSARVRTQPKARTTSAPSGPLERNEEVSAGTASATLRLWRERASSPQRRAFATQRLFWAHRRPGIEGRATEEAPTMRATLRSPSGRAPSAWEDGQPDWARGRCARSCSCLRCPARALTRLSATLPALSPALCARLVRDTSHPRARRCRGLQSVARCRPFAPRPPATRCRSCRPLSARRGRARRWVTCTWRGWRGCSRTTCWGSTATALRLQMRSR